jgi:hypothetical protein
MLSMLPSPPTVPGLPTLLGLPTPPTRLTSKLTPRF